MVNNEFMELLNGSWKGWGIGYGMDWNKINRIMDEYIYIEYDIDDVYDVEISRYECVGRIFNGSGDSEDEIVIVDVNGVLRMIRDDWEIYDGIEDILRRVD